MKKSVIVFGGNGFIGQYLVDQLVRKGYDVTSADISVDEEREDIDSIRCDIMDREQILEILDQGNYQFVFNLAGFANLDEAVRNPHRAFELNVIGNINILDGAHRNNVERFIYASSAYAMSNKGSYYGISKLTSEKIVEEYQRRHGLKFTILRYGSIYSAKSFDNNYIYSIVEKALKTGSIEHGGDGEEIREYVHAVDAAKLSVDVIESEEFVNEHVILTGIEKMKRVELFEMIKEMLNDQIDIKLGSGKYNHHYKYTPYSFNPQTCKKLIANPHIDIGQGILDCIRAISND